MTKCQDGTIRKFTNRAVKCIRDEGHGGAHKWVSPTERIVLLWFKDEDHDREEVA